MNSPQIYTIRGQRVLLDHQLAELYGVSTKRLNEAVKRNPLRFPDWFMFQLSSEELAYMWSQFATTYRLTARKHVTRTHLPYAFTEHGILMLASVLNSSTAIQVSLAIIEVFVSLRAHFEGPLNHRVDQLEDESKLVRELFDDVLKRLQQLEQTGLPKRQKKIGLKT